MNHYLAEEATAISALRGLACRNETFDERNCARSDLPNNTYELRAQSRAETGGKKADEHNVCACLLYFSIISSWCCDYQTKAANNIKYGAVQQLMQGDLR